MIDMYLSLIHSLSKLGKFFGLIFYRDDNK